MAHGAHGRAERVQVPEGQLNPSAEDGMCSLHIAFGKQHVMVPVTVAKKK